MTSDVAGLIICGLLLGAMAIVGAFRNISLRDEVKLLADRLAAIRDHSRSPHLEAQIFAAICEHNQDSAIDYGDRKEMADLIAKAVRAQINQH
jgi:predicted transcriptional regulator